MDLSHRVRDLAAAALPDTIRIRRYLHRNPELSFAEYDTQAFVASRLTELGIPHVRLAGTGLLAHIKGEKGDGPTVALRADMDALPIEEKNNVDYASTKPGVMHACGHDVHTACLLGAAGVLQTLRPHFGGMIRLLFQPGEEQLPGGATLMIEDGALKNPAPAGIFGQHVHPPLEAGKVGFRPGIYMASTDELYVSIKGRGGHGAMPHLAVDPIVIAAHVVTAAQQLISRNTDPTLPAVLTFGRINSTGGATNVIPNEVVLQGTLRTLNEPWRRELHERLQELVTGVAKSMGGTAEVRIAHGYPFLKNDERLTGWASSAARAYLGPENVVELPIRMTGEDFAFYTHHVPACFYRLGIRNEAKGITHPVHTDRFDVDENCLETGAGLMAWLALGQLSDSVAPVNE